MEVVGCKIGLKKTGLSLCILSTPNRFILMLLVKRSMEQPPSFPLEPCRSVHADQAPRGVLSHSGVHSGRFLIYKSEKMLGTHSSGVKIGFVKVLCCFSINLGQRLRKSVRKRNLLFDLIQSNQDRESRQDLD